MMAGLDAIPVPDPEVRPPQSVPVGEPPSPLARLRGAASVRAARAPLRAAPT